MEDLKAQLSDLQRKRELLAQRREAESKVLDSFSVFESATQPLIGFPQNVLKNESPRVHLVLDEGSCISFESSPIDKASTDAVFKEMSMFL